MEKLRLGYIVISDSTYKEGYNTRFTAHETEKEAQEEAERLARLEGMPFVVYKPVLCVGPADIVVIRLDDPGKPRTLGTIPAP